MYQLIVSPFLSDYVVLRPGSDRGLKISHHRYEALRRLAVTNHGLPRWLSEAASRQWGLHVTGTRACEALLVRTPSSWAFGRASYEVNLNCNYKCEHCYHGQKSYPGLSWEGRERLLRTMRDAGVLWLQLTGGEPLIDPLFAPTYSLAYDLGMMMSVLSNGSRLSSPAILGLFAARPLYQISVSVYGASAESYERLTGQRGSFRAFQRGIAAAQEAELPLRLHIIVSQSNAHEVDAMVAMAEQLGMPHHIYATMLPTFDGSPKPLRTQAETYRRTHAPFIGCNAGRTFFHVDAYGMVCVCKSARASRFSLVEAGITGLSQLPTIADSTLHRSGECADCLHHDTCGTCMPMAELYRAAKAPLSIYCQRCEESQAVMVKDDKGLETGPADTKSSQTTEGSIEFREEVSVIENLDQIFDPFRCGWLQRWHTGVT